MIVFMNGRYLPATRARVSVFDRGFLYGEGLFETLRAYRGEPFAVEEHLERLRSGAGRLGFPVPGDRRRWTRVFRELLRRNRLVREDAVIRLTVTRGTDRAGLVPSGRSRPTTVVTVRRLDPDLARLRRRGVAVVTLPFRPGAADVMAGLKTTAYLPAVLGKERAVRARAFEGIYTDSPTGNLLEGTTSNLFVIRGRRLVTPPLAAGILPGVTRAEVLRLGAEAGLRPVERPVRTAEMRDADEAFLTASTIEILPVRSLDGLEVSRGPLTGRIHALYREVVRERVG